MDNYFFLSDIGECPLPNKNEIEKHLNETGEEIILVLDSSVYIEIVNLIKWKKDFKSDKNKIFNLIEYIKKNNVDYLSQFSMLECSYDRDTLIVDNEKFINDFTKLKFAFEYPLKKLKKFAFNDVLTKFESTPPTFPSDLITDVLDTRINVFYTALLKICQLAKINGISKDKAEKNMKAFLDWMQNDLEIILANESIIALNIFGGNSKFGSMLKLGSSKEKILKATIGTAWDSFHARMSINRELISNICGKKLYPIFVTKDKMLHQLMAPYVSRYEEREYKKVKLIESDVLPEFYSKDFINHFNDFMLNRTIETFHSDSDFGTEKIYKIKSMISELEASIG